MTYVIQQWCSTVSERALDRGVDAHASGYWETIVTDGARPLPAFTAETADAYMATHGLTGRDWRKVPA